MKDVIQNIRNTIEQSYNVRNNSFETLTKFLKEHQHVSQQSALNVFACNLKSVDAEDISFVIEGIYYADSSFYVTYTDDENRVYSQYHSLELVEYLLIFKYIEANFKL